MFCLCSFLLKLLLTTVLRKYLSVCKYMCAGLIFFCLHSTNVFPQWFFANAEPLRDERLMSAIFHGWNARFINVFFAVAPSLGKWRSAHSVVGAHAGLQARNHPHRLRRRPDHHLPDEKPHVLHSDHEETAGMSPTVITMTLRYIKYRNNLL